MHCLLDVQMRKCMEVEEKLKSMDREISINPQYVQKVRRDCLSPSFRSSKRVATSEFGFSRILTKCPGKRRLISKLICCA